VPGWSTKIIETKLATPIKQGGETINTEVSQIVWTWVGPLGKANNGQFINFPLDLAIPEKNLVLAGLSDVGPAGLEPATYRLWDGSD
jgi:hypothetical protein